MSESIETEKLYKLIEAKKSYLQKLTNEFARKNLQQEILFLENDLMPIVARNTTLLYDGIHKYLDKYIREAVKMKNDAVLMFIPLTDITDKCNIGIVNPKKQKFGSENIDSLEIYIDNMGVAGRDIKVNLIDV